MKPFTTQRLVRNLCCFLFPLLSLFFLPAWICTVLSGKLLDQDPETIREMSKGMTRWTDGTLTLDDLSTGNALFDGEWFFGTFQMAAMGYGQSCILGVLEPETALERMEECFVLLRSAPVREFDVRIWKSDPLEDLEIDTNHHVAYLGYYNLAMSLAREIQRRHPEARGISQETVQLNDAISRALARRFQLEHPDLLQTYPGQYYPVDNVAAIASVGLYAKATDTVEFDGILAAWEQSCWDLWVDKSSGLLYQSAIKGRDPLDVGRVSGTALSAYFLAYSHPELSAELSASCFSLSDAPLGFGMLREYPRGSRRNGDIDSGPILFGYGVTATGVSISNARIHGEKNLLRKLLRTAVLAGAPARSQNEWHWITGGSIGDAILFAMMTAPPLDLIHPEEGR